MVTQMRLQRALASLLWLWLSFSSALASQDDAISFQFDDIHIILNLTTNTALFAACSAADPGCHFSAAVRGDPAGFGAVSVCPTSNQPFEVVGFAVAFGMQMLIEPLRSDLSASGSYSPVRVFRGHQSAWHSIRRVSAESLGLSDRVLRAPQPLPQADGPPMRLQSLTAQALDPNRTRHVELLLVNDAARHSLLGALTEQTSAAAANMAAALYARAGFDPPVRLSLVAQVTFAAGSGGDPYNVSRGQCTGCAPGEVSVEVRN